MMQLISAMLFELLDGSEELELGAAIFSSCWKWKVGYGSSQIGKFILPTDPTQWKTLGHRIETEKEYLPYSIGLNKIENEFYQGTDIPHNFESYVTLNLKTDRKKCISLYEHSS